MAVTEGHRIDLVSAALYVCLKRVEYQFAFNDANNWLEQKDKK